MKELIKAEETILLAIWRLGKDAYGVTIKNQIKKTTNRKYLYSTLYTTPEQLVSVGLIDKRFGEPSAVRGGKRKIFFDITEEGFAALERAYRTNQAMWDGISEDSFLVKWKT